MEKMKTVCLLICMLLACSEAAKILVVFPMPSKSHANLGNGYVRHLLKAGHEVTYITPYAYKNAPPSLRTIDVSSNIALVPEDMLSLKGIMEEGSFEISPNFMTFFMIELVKNTVENEGVQKLLNDPKEQFDAVVVEWLYGDIFAGFASVFQSPLIWSSSMDPHWLVLQLIDEPLNPAYAVDSMSPYFPPLSFLQRVNELWTQLKVQFLRYVWLDSVEEKVFTSLFTPIAEKRGIKLPTYKESRYNASLILSNAYVTTSGGASLPQSHKFIGGYHIDDVVIPLPERVDLSYKMPDELKKKIVEVTSNKRYANKAKQLSFIHHDRPVKPGQELVHWVNHVINTRGAPHLRSPALDLPFYKRKFLDLAALIAVLLLAVYVLLKKACAYICSQVCSKKGKAGSKKKNN
ncbi:hypothetical protein PYW07_009114 [Mythimna separata]|uniref:Uncharacterized protein n=1 Tax=Mythimna separata TaxID=271217 RepID=A0AAD7YBV2_MYTSE|nr:hypothetical protein PYW07_009114 [Mythimna separata]